MKKVTAGSGGILEITIEIIRNFRISIKLERIEFKIEVITRSKRV